jgi:hypothetical protein
MELFSIHLNIYRAVRRTEMYFTEIQFCTCKSIQQSFGMAATRGKNGLEKHRLEVGLISETIRNKTPI